MSEYCMASSTKCGWLSFKTTTTNDYGCCSVGMHLNVLNSFSWWRLFPAAGCEASPWASPACPIGRLCASMNLGPPLQKPLPALSFAHALLTHPHMAQPHSWSLLIMIQIPISISLCNICWSTQSTILIPLEFIGNFLSSTYKVFLCGMLYYTCPQQMYVSTYCMPGALPVLEIHMRLFPWSLYLH